MEFTTNDLLLANAVMLRVIAKRNALTLNMSDEEREEFNNKPVDDLIEQALTEIEGIAKVIAKIRGSRPTT